MPAAMRGWWSVMAAAAVMLLVGCVSNEGPTTTTVSKSYGDPLLDRYAGNFDYKKDGGGSTKIVSGQRSSFEGTRASGFDKGFQGAHIRTNEVEKAPWWGRKGYEKQVWNGGKLASEGSKRSRFGSKRPSEAGQVALLDGRNYETSSYATSVAREQGVPRIGKPRDALTENRRADFPQPAIRGWEKQREMDMEETKGILGR